MKRKPRVVRLDAGDVFEIQSVSGKPLLRVKMGALGSRGSLREVAVAVNVDRVMLLFLGWDAFKEKASRTFELKD